MQLSYRHYLDASHQLQDSENLITKKCANLHGHTYAIQVTVDSVANQRSGMIIDFSAIKNVLDVLDHQHINKVFEQSAFFGQPTAENIALFLKRQVLSLFPEGATVTLAVNEGYKGEDKGAWVTV